MAGTECMRAVSENLWKDWTPSKGSLVPHKDAPGTDIFQNHEGFTFIVRSDLGCYLRTKDINRGTGIEIRRLHPACQGGDHYLRGLEDDICIIKGDSYRLVKDLSTDAGARVHELHPSCRGGDHYLFSFHGFHIIFLEHGQMHHCSNMTQPLSGGVSPLNPNYHKGLYHFGNELFPSLIQVDEKWGAQCVVYADSDLEPRSSFSIHPDVLNFLPGGLTLTKGTSTGGWECIKTLRNDSDSPITWSDKVTCKVGYNKQQMSSMEHNWNISSEVSIGAGELIKLITQFQFSFKAEYGGRSVRTEQEDWNEAREEEESIQVILEPQKNLYIWQYSIGFGQNPVLFCRNVHFTKENNPPKHIPLPPVP